MSFGFILAEKAVYPIRLMCRVLEVSTPGFYAWCHRKPSLRARKDAVWKVLSGRDHGLVFAACVGLATVKYNG